MKTIFLLFALTCEISLGISQGLNPQTFLGFGAGIGMPVNYSALHPEVAEGLPAIWTSILVSTKVSGFKPLENAEMMLNINFADKRSRHEARFQRANINNYSTTLTQYDIVLQSMFLFNIPFFKESRRGLSLKLGPAIGFAALGKGNPTCLTFINLERCSISQELTYLEADNTTSFRLDPSLAIKLTKLSRLGPNKGVALRYGLLADIHPVALNNIHSIIKHDTMPFDGVVKWNRSSLQLMIQLSIAKKETDAAKKEINKKRFKNDHA